MRIVSTQDYEEVIMGEFNRRFSPQQIRIVLENAVERGFTVMEDATPVVSGELLLSEGWGLRSDTEAEMYANAPYASAVNGGTSKQPPQPFFDRGVEAVNQRLKENLEVL